MTIDEADYTNEQIRKVLIKKKLTARMFAEKGGLSFLEVVDYLEDGTINDRIRQAIKKHLICI